MPVSTTLPDVIAAPLNRLAVRYAESPLPRFLQWWGGELRALLPARWRDTLAVEAAQVLLEVEADGVQVATRAGGVETPLERLSLSDRGALPTLLATSLGDARAGLRRVLVLPRAQVLRRTLSLPAAALENLRAVVGFELDRQTPFKPDQVYYDCRVQRRAAGAKLVEVELVLVPRAALNRQLDALGPLAATLDAADTRDADGAPLGVNFLPAERRRRRAHSRVWLNLALAAAALLLLWLAAWQSLENRRQAVAELETLVDERRAEARQVNQLREALADAAEGANFLAVQRERQPLMLVLLAELTTLLPDDTYLERFSFDDGQLNLTGQSSQAAQLIGSLQASGELRNPALAGSIQPDARTGKDRFTITAGYGPAEDAE